MNNIVKIIPIVATIVSIVFFILYKKSKISKTWMNLVYVFAFIAVSALLIYELSVVNWKFKVDEEVWSIISIGVDIFLAFIGNYKKLVVDFNYLNLKRELTSNNQYVLRIEIIDDKPRIEKSYTLYIRDLEIYFVLIPEVFNREFKYIYNNCDNQLFCKKVKFDPQKVKLNIENHQAIVVVQDEFKGSIPDEIFDKNAMDFVDRKMLVLRLNGYFVSGKYEKINELKFWLKNFFKTKKWSRNIKFELTAQNDGKNYYKFSI